MGGYREDIEGLRINCIGINIHVEINGGRDLWIHKRNSGSDVS